MLLYPKTSLSLQYDTWSMLKLKWNESPKLADVCYIILEFVAILSWWKYSLNSEVNNSTTIKIITSHLNSEIKKTITYDVGIPVDIQLQWYRFASTQTYKNEWQHSMNG